MGIFNLIKKKKPVEEDLEKSLFSVMDFLANVSDDAKEVYELGVKVKKLRSKERSEINDKKQLRLLEDEIKSWDRFLERYVMFQRDVAVTGQRVKKVSKILQGEVSKMDINPEIKSLVKEKDEWVFNW